MTSSSTSRPILVVEDEIVIADELCLILKKEGFQVLEPAISYNEATRSFLEHNPSLIILDVELSGNKTGLDVADYIRKRSEVPFLFITSCNDPKSMAEIAAFEPLACLEKIYLKAQLLEKVALVLGKAQVGSNLLANLTKRERSILQHISKGLSTELIAEQLNLSKNTVKNHRHNICKKLNLPAKSNSLVNWVLQNQGNLKF